MARIVGIVALLLVVVYAATSLGEIVKVTADRTKIYDGDKVRSVKIKGKRFMVYGSARDWYLVEMKINKKKVFRWIPKADVTVDWGRTRTARVVKVRDVNTLKLSNGDSVRFAGVVVDENDTPLTRRTLAWLKAKLEGKRVTLEYDKKPRKRGGCDLVYVYVGRVFVNRALVKSGLARVPYSYRKDPGRYIKVFVYFDRVARKQGKGIWAQGEPEEQPEEKTDESEPLELEEGLSLELTGPEEPQHERTLSDAEKAQWARSLQTKIAVTTKRTKTERELVSRDQNPGVQIPTETTVVCAKTLVITVRNGWSFRLDDLTAKYDFFARTGKTSDTVLLRSSGEITGVDLKPGEARELKSEPVDFETKEEYGWADWQDGWSGQKYYGYRVTFLFRGTTVKVVAKPATLADFKVPSKD